MYIEKTIPNRRGIFWSESILANSICMPAGPTTKPTRFAVCNKKKQKTRGSFLFLGEGKKTGYISRDTINKVKFQPKQGWTQTLTLLSWTKSSRTLANENIKQKNDGLRLLTEAQMDNMKLLRHHVFCIILCHLNYGSCLDVQTNAIAMETFWSKHH